MTEKIVIEPLDPPLTGGCQCGAVRYAVHMKPIGAHYCHCRMCQRAVGNVFAALAPARKDKIEWTTGKPEFYRSSSVAHRGFCPKCGTPLTFAYDESEWMCVTIGSLDEPSRVPPTINYGVESTLPWVHLDESMKQERTDENERVKGMETFQFMPQSHG